jgi:hypothetical protein
MKKRIYLFFLLLTTFMGAKAFNVTFRVDMNGLSGFATPEVNGTFNGWCGNCNPMTDANADGVWEATLNLPPGSYEYKFSYDLCKFILIPPINHLEFRITKLFPECSTIKWEQRLNILF